MTDNLHLVHGTCVALAAGDDRWAGILLRGPSGSGKSDLALRLIDEGARLVADDQTALSRVDGMLRACPPASIAGKIEVRGMGIFELPYLADVPLQLVCDLVAPAQVARLPDPAVAQLLGHDLPRIALAPFEASAVAKLRLGVRAARHGIIGGSN